MFHFVYGLIHKLKCRYTYEIKLRRFDYILSWDSGIETEWRRTTKKLIGAKLADIFPSTGWACQKFQLPAVVKFPCKGGDLYALLLTDDVPCSKKPRSGSNWNINIRSLGVGRAAWQLCPTNCLVQRALAWLKNFHSAPNNSSGSDRSIERLHNWYAVRCLTCHRKIVF